MLDDHDSYPDDECEHLDADFDVLTGREECSCGWARWLTTEECLIRAKEESERYDVYHAEMEEATKQYLMRGVPETFSTTIGDNEIPF